MSSDAQISSSEIPVERIKRAITIAGPNISSLSVTRDDAGAVTLSGRCDSFYSKKIAQDIALVITESAVRNLIVVDS